MKTFFDKFEEFALVLFLCIMSVILMLQIISRYIFSYSFTWSEEMVRYIFVWTTFLGVPYCIKKGQSLKITLVIDRLPEKIKKNVIKFNLAILFIFFIILSVYGVVVVKNAINSAQVSPALGIPLWVLYFSVPFSSILSIIRLAEKIIIFTRENKFESEF